jgi:transcriptional regulator with XRE-family HTH domain
MSTLAELEGRVQARSELPSPPVRRALREAAGASLDEVGSVVGVTRQAVALWESGERTPRGANLGGYVAVLRVFRRAMSETEVGLEKAVA